MQLIANDDMTFKIEIWGSCLSHDFVDALNHLYPNIILERSYLFRLPTINALSIPKAFGIDISQFRKI